MDGLTIKAEFLVNVKNEKNLPHPSLIQDVS